MRRCARSSTGERAPQVTTAEYIARLLTQVGEGEYQLGAGGYDPKAPDTCFHPHWDTKHKPGVIGCDCSAFAIKFGLKLAGHRPGFGSGRGANVTDYINSDSALFDAIHNRELFELVEGPPIEGDLLIIPSRFDAHGVRIGIGHVLATKRNRALEWDHAQLPRPWDKVDVVQCRGPNGMRPGVIESTAIVCARHDAKWVKVPEMWTQVVRVRAEVLAAI